MRGRNTHFGNSNSWMASDDEITRIVSPQISPQIVSGLDSFELTRSFYRKNGYDEEARIRDFYRAGDDKIVFRKALDASKQ